MNAVITENWTALPAPEEPDFIEHLLEVKSEKYGQCILKVWMDMNDEYRYSITTFKGERHTGICENAKTESCAKKYTLNLI